MPDAAWVALSLIRGVGGHLFNTLVEVFGSPELVLKASPRRLQSIKGVGTAISAAIEAVDLGRMADDLARWQASGIHAITFESPQYPEKLRGLSDAPLTLFVRGCWPVDLANAVAIVGTRTPSPAAVEFAQQLSHQCVRAGRTIVSGLALGIDYAAHHSAVAAPGGVTAAVLGGGILSVYPPQHRELAQTIELRGALICEVRPDLAVSKTGLVTRNRIISGLADAVVIVQTDSDGGALYAARFAKAQGRKVYVVKDPLDNPAAQRGIDVLLAEGAEPLSPHIKDTLLP